jgi:hypothetical protein
MKQYLFLNVFSGMREVFEPIAVAGARRVIDGRSESV